MSDDRIERALRQRGPREPEAHLAPLPADLAEATLELRALERRRSPLRIVGVGAGMVLVSAAAVVVVLAVSSRLPQPSVGGRPSSTPGAVASSTTGATPTPSAIPAALVACQPAAVRAQAEAWGGAAGSRGAMVTVTNVGTVACTLHGSPGAEIRDANGSVVVATKNPDGGTGAWSNPRDPTLILKSGESATTSVVWSNWCGANPQAPLAVRLILSTGALDVHPNAASPNVLVPPCNGDQPSSLSTIAFQSP
jgi:hypothetical protein